MANDYMDYRVFLDGEKLFEEGERGNEAFIVRQGTVKIVRYKGAKEEILGMRDAETVVGEMAVISDMPRMATAVAIGETHVYAMTRGVFHTLMERSDIETRSMLHFLVDFIRDAELDPTASGSGGQPFKRRILIARNLINAPNTQALLGTREPVFLMLCKTLLQRANEAIERLGS